MSKTTDDLLKQLSNVNTLSELKKYAASSNGASHPLSLHEYLSVLISQSAIPVSELVRRSGIQRNYAYQILSGAKHPGRDKIIALCISLNLSLDETQRALTIAKEGVLYPKNKRDSILIFSINKSMSVQETNELLYEMNEPVL